MPVHFRMPRIRKRDEKKPKCPIQQNWKTTTIENIKTCNKKQQRKLEMLNRKPAPPSDDNKFQRERRDRERLRRRRRVRLRDRRRSLRASEASALSRRIRSALS